MNTDTDKNGHMMDNETNISSPTRNDVIFDLQTLLSQRQDMLWNVLHERYNKFNTSIKRGQNFLLKHIDSKLSLIVIYAV